MGQRRFSVRCLASYQRMCRRATDFIIAELERRPDLLLGASSGRTPTLAYHMLSAERARQPGRFERLRVLKIDEWCGLADNDPASCEMDLRTKLLDPLGVGGDRYVGFRGDAIEPSRECARISRWLAGHGPIDLCVLGLGENGHVALNEPGAALCPRTHVAALSKRSQRHPMLKRSIRRPTHGMTLGIGDILGSRRLLLLVSGSHKRDVLARLCVPAVTARFPASFLWLHPDVTILCDTDAARGIPKETIW